jgi:hypothetical protein
MNFKGGDVCRERSDCPPLFPDSFDEVTFLFDWKAIGLSGYHRWKTRCALNAKLFISASWRGDVVIANRENAVASAPASHPTELLEPGSFIQEPFHLASKPNSRYHAAGSSICTFTLCGGIFEAKSNASTDSSKPNRSVISGLTSILPAPMSASARGKTCA